MWNPPMKIADRVRPRLQDRKRSGRKGGTRSLVAALVALVGVALSALVATPAQAIVGLEPAAEDVTYPWAAAFITPDDGWRSVQARTYCSGVLIKPRWVLTAAHCPISGADIVTIGRGRLASSQGERRTVLFSLEMQGSSTYCSSGFAQWCDLALVRLNAPSTQPDLDLADANEFADWGVGTAARVYGYGQEFASLELASAHLRRGHLEIDDFEENHYLMSASGPGTSTCRRDSGAPLIVSTSNGPRVVGINTASTSGCIKGAFNTFVKVGWRGTSRNSPGFRWVSATI